MRANPSSLLSKHRLIWFSCIISSQPCCGCLAVHLCKCNAHWPPSVMWVVLAWQSGATNSSVLTFDMLTSAGWPQHHVQVCVWLVRSACIGIRHAAASSFNGFQNWLKRRSILFLSLEFPATKAWFRTVRWLRGLLHVFDWSVMVLGVCKTFCTCRTTRCTMVQPDWQLKG